MQLRWGCPVVELDSEDGSDLSREGKGKGKFKGKNDDDQARERERWRRWDREHRW